MKEDYEKSKVDLQKGLDGIQAALEKLQTYYGLSPRPWSMQGTEAHQKTSLEKC